MVVFEVDEVDAVSVREGDEEAEEVLVDCEERDEPLLVDVFDF